MATTHPRRLCNVPVGKITAGCLLLALLLCGLSVQAQTNRTKYDLRWFNLGFMAGLNITDINLRYGDLGRSRGGTEGLLRDIRIRNTPGINLGMITNFRLNNNMDFRFIPAVSLQQRNFDYVFETAGGGDSTVTRKLEASYVDLPVFLKFKSDLYRNFRAYFMVGGKLSYNLVSDKEALDDPNLIRIDRVDYALVFALGGDIYSDRVKLCPEIRYSIGLRNIYIPDNTNYGEAIQSIGTQSILIAINFE